MVIKEVLQKVYTYDDLCCNKQLLDMIKLKCYDLYNILGEAQDLLLLEFSNRFMLFYHDQECCESVYLEDGLADLRAMIGDNVYEMTVSQNYQDDPPNYFDDESYTWTYYVFKSFNRDVVLRFFGSSNGYYSESVDYDLFYKDFDINKINRLYI